MTKSERAISAITAILPNLPFDEAAKLVGRLKTMKEAASPAGKAAEDQVKKIDDLLKQIDAKKSNQGAVVQARVGNPVAQQKNNVQVNVQNHVPPRGNIGNAADDVKNKDESGSATIGQKEYNEKEILFGQRRVGQKFSQGSPNPKIKGRPINEVAAGLKNGTIKPDELPIEAFRLPDGRLVSANTRSLSALSKAGMKPTKVKIVKADEKLKARLKETPIIDEPLPGRRVPVTRSQTDLRVIEIIELPNT